MKDNPVVYLSGVWMEDARRVAEFQTAEGDFFQIIPPESMTLVLGQHYRLSFVPCEAPGVQS